MRASPTASAPRAPIQGRYGRQQTHYRGGERQGLEINSHSAHGAVGLGERQRERERERER